MKDTVSLVRYCPHGRLMISYSFLMTDPNTGEKITKVMPSCEACGTTGTELRPFHPPLSRESIGDPY